MINDKVIERLECMTPAINQQKLTAVRDCNKLRMAKAPAECHLIDHERAMHVRHSENASQTHDS
jgi:hypothetical protein